ncbi:MAG: hypothetical protein R6V46_18705 [Desulfatiglandaceae bacterium]
MISQSFDFGEFVEAVKEKGWPEILGLADKEALEAWRLSSIQKDMSDDVRDLIRQYESTLKEFICFMRSAVFPKTEKDPHHQLFHALRTAILQRG